MNKISIGSLRSNSYINRPVFLDKEYILLSPDVAISEELLKRLQKWDYEEIQTDGVPIEGTPPGNNHDGSVTAIFESNEKEIEEEKQSQSFFDECVNFLVRYYDNFRELDALPLLPISDMVKEIISELKGHKDLLLNINSELKESDSYIVHHSIKTALLVLSIADFLKFPAHKQIEIGIAAMLHKLGMLRLPSKLYQKKSGLTPQELQVIQTHPVISYKTLKAAEFQIPIYVAVLEHHEHIDGTGYPRKLKGDKISLYGKILAVSSAFAAATTRRPFREELDGHSGIMDLLKSKGTKYDEGILRALVFIMSVYPIGTFVQLSNQAKGIVIKINLATPRNPILKLLIDENGVLYKNKPILRTRPEDEIQITGTLTKEDILKIKAQLNLPE